MDYQQKLQYQDCRTEFQYLFSMHFRQQLYDHEQDSVYWTVLFEIQTLLRFTLNLHKLEQI